MLCYVLTFFILFVIVLVIAKAGMINRLTLRTPCSLILIPTCGNEDILEQRVRAFYAEQLFCDGRYVSDIIIVITEKRFEDTALDLADKLDGVSAVRLSELEDHISKNYDEYKNIDS